MDYEKQGLKFLKDTGTEFKAEFLKHGKHFSDDKDERDIYLITLKRGNRVYKFNFGQSIEESGFKIINQNTNQEVKYNWLNELTFNKDRNLKKLKIDVGRKFGYLMGMPYRECMIIKVGKVPTAYDILTSLTKYEVGNFKDFCDEYGYDNDSIKAEKTYHAVLKEWQNIKMLYSDTEIEKLQEIQ